MSVLGSVPPRPWIGLWSVCKSRNVDRLESHATAAMPGVLRYGDRQARYTEGRRSAWCRSSYRDPDRAASFAMCFVRVQRLFVFVGRVRAHSNTTVLVAAQRRCCS